MKWVKIVFALNVNGLVEEVSNIIESNISFSCNKPNSQKLVPNHQFIILK